MATFPISSLVPLLRVMCDDNDVSLQQFTDKQLSDEYLKTAIMLQEASWDNGYSVELNPGDNTVDPHIEPFYEIVGDKDVPQWLQVLYVLKCALGMQIWQEKYSFDNKVIKVTNTSKKDDIEGLKFLYQEILDERKNSGVGFAYTSFDDFFTRYYNILDEISEGYR